MSKAEDLAEKAYPQEMDGYCENNAAMRVGFKIGYNQAEKDLELSWEDIESIITISYLLDKEEETTGKYAKIMTHYQEVLKRFNEQRKEK